MPEAHQNDHSYVRELSESTFNSLWNIIGGWLYKGLTPNLSKLGVGTYTGMHGRLSGQYGNKEFVNPVKVVLAANKFSEFRYLAKSWRPRYNRSQAFVLQNHTCTWCALI